MSPFEHLVERLAVRVRGLDSRAQVALFVSAALATEARWREWALAANTMHHVDLFDRAAGLATGFAIARTPDLPRAILSEVEAAVPSDPSDVPGFTAAQDCWICLDTAIRSALGEFDPAASTWYLLEPLFQATSEKHFGYTDVGSERQAEAEREVLTDPAVKAAVQAIEGAIELLRTRPVDTSLLDVVQSRLRVIRA